MHYRITQPVTAEEFRKYYHLRWKILRAPWQQPEGSEIDDTENQCFHVMATDADKNVIGVARLQFNTSDEAQIRYMAVADKHKNKGIGRALMHAMEQHASDNGCHQIVLDAREGAVDFYKKLSYKTYDKSYLLFDEIQHFRMSKKL